MLLLWLKFVNFLLKFEVWFWAWLLTYQIDKNIIIDKPQPNSYKLDLAFPSSLLAKTFPNCTLFLLSCFSSSKLCNSTNLCYGVVIIPVYSTTLQRSFIEVWHTILYLKIENMVEFCMILNREGIKMLLQGH